MNKKNIVFILLTIFSINSIAFVVANEDYVRRYFHRPISIIADIDLTDYDRQQRLIDKLDHPIFQETKELKLDTNIDGSQILENKFENFNEQDLNNFDNLDITPPTNTFENNQNLENENYNDVFNKGNLLNYQQYLNDKQLQKELEKEKIKNDLTILQDVNTNLNKEEIEDLSPKSVSYLDFIKENPNFEQEYLPRKSKNQINNAKNLNLELSKDQMQKIINSNQQNNFSLNYLN